MHRRTLLAGLGRGCCHAVDPPRPRPTGDDQFGEDQDRLAARRRRPRSGQEVNRLTDAFNASQNEVEVTAIYKGGYPDVLTATIAAYRAGQAPHIAQIFEVGTGTMLAAGKAVKQIWELAKETGVTIDPNSYIASVRGYYSLADGRMASMPFNSSTAVMWINRDAFRKAGLDPAKPPATWPEVVAAAAQAIKAKSAAEIPMTTAWADLDPALRAQHSALHNIPFATEGDGFDGLNAALAINSQPHAKRTSRACWRWRRTAPSNTPAATTPPILAGFSGQAGIHFDLSSGMRGDLVKNARIRLGGGSVPAADDPEIIKSPLNSIIGGASLWPMTAPGRTPAEYKAVAQFLTPFPQHAGERAAAWHQHTGYAPVTLGRLSNCRSQAGLLRRRTPGADLPVVQLTRVAR